VNFTRCKETQIAAYLEGRLSEEEKNKVEEALAEDDKALEELLALHRISRAAPEGELEHAPSRIIERAVGLASAQKSIYDVVLEYSRRMLHVLDPGAMGTVSLMPVPESLRAEEAVAAPTIVVRKNLPAGKAALYIESAGAGLCTITVSLPEQDRAMSGRLRAEVEHGGRVLASEYLEEGRAVFEKLEPGRYKIVLRRNRANMGDFSVRIIEPTGGERDD